MCRPYGGQRTALGNGGRPQGSPLRCSQPVPDRRVLGPPLRRTTDRSGERRATTRVAPTVLPPHPRRAGLGPTPTANNGPFGGTAGDHKGRPYGTPDPSLQRMQKRLPPSRRGPRPARRTRIQQEGAPFKDAPSSAPVCALGHLPPYRGKAVLHRERWPGRGRRRG